MYDQPEAVQQYLNVFMQVNASHLKKISLTNPLSIGQQQWSTEHTLEQLVQAAVNDTKLAMPVFEHLINELTQIERYKGER